MNEEQQHRPPCRNLHELARHLKRLSDEEKLITVERLKLVEAYKQLSRRIHELTTESNQVSDDIHSIVKSAINCKSDSVLDETLLNDTQVTVIPDYIKSETTMRRVIKKTFPTDRSGSRLSKGQRVKILSSGRSRTNRGIIVWIGLAKVTIQLNKQGKTTQRSFNNVRICY